MGGKQGGVRRTQASSDSGGSSSSRPMYGRSSRPLGSDAREQRVSSSGAPSTLDTLCFSAEQILTLPPRSENPDRLPPTPGAHSSRPFVGHMLARLCGLKSLASPLN